jgi:hypothetical protein
MIVQNPKNHKMATRALSTAQTLSQLFAALINGYCTTDRGLDTLKTSRFDPKGNLSPLLSSGACKRGGSACIKPSTSPRIPHGPAIWKDRPHELPLEALKPHGLQQRGSDSSRDPNGLLECQQTSKNPTQPPQD